MADETFYTILTALGKAKLANAQSNSTSVDFATMKAGDGGGDYYSPSEDQTALVNQVWSGAINSIYINPNNETYVIVEAVIPEDVGNFYIREVGIFDDEGDMIGIGKYPETYKPTLAQGSGKDLYLRYIMETSNAAEVELKIDPSVVLATKNDVAIHEAKAASETAAGHVELATSAETLTGTDNTRAVHPAGLKAAIDALLDGAPGALDTLNELSAALGDDADFAATITTALAGKAALGGLSTQVFKAAPATADDEVITKLQAQGLIANLVPYGFYKLDPMSVALIKTGAETLSIKAGTSIEVAGQTITFAADTALVMPSMSAGIDYAWYACTDGTVRADVSFTAPTGYDISNSRLMGGFHYGLVAPGETVAGGSFATTGNGMIWTQADVDAIAGINAFSLWDLKWRPLCDPKGMALVSGRTWVDIYLCGTNHTTNGTSKAGTDIASGTVLPKKPLEFGGNGTVTYATPMWWDFVEIANAYKKRLLREQEFILAAFGVTENQSIDSTAATYPTTQRNAGYTSKYGLEQASGHHYTWGEDTGMYYDTTTWSWKTSNGGRGQIYTQGTYGLTRVFLGGARTYGVYSGSRCSSWSGSPWHVGWGIGLRAACDHLALV